MQLWPQASLTSSSSQGHSPFNSTRQALRPAAARATAPSIQQIPAVGSRLQAYRLPALKASKILNLLNPPSRSQDRPRPTVFKGVQGCGLPGSTPLKPAKPSAGPPRQALRPAAARATAPSIQQIPAVGTPNCFSESSSLPFARLKASKPSKPSQPEPGQAASNCF